MVEYLQILDLSNACSYTIPYTPYTSSIPYTPYTPYTPYIPYTYLNDSLYDCYIGIQDRLQWSTAVYSSV